MLARLRIAHALGEPVERSLGRQADELGSRDGAWRAIAATARARASAWSSTFTRPACVARAAAQADRAQAGKPPAPPSRMARDRARVVAVGAARARR